MHAYVTLLSTPDYLPGVAGLAASLRRTGTTLPLVVAVSAALPATAARRVARLPGVDEVLRLPAEPLLPDGASRQGHHWDHSFDKLRLFGLAGWSKLVYLDSDMLVLDRLDDLFAQPHMAAVAAGRLVQPGWTRLNSGLMVIEPAPGLPLCIAQTLRQAIHEMVRDGRPALGDQDLINSHYGDWPEHGPHLDEGDNVFFEHLEAYLASGRYVLPWQAAGDGTRAVRVVHFVGRHKPWMARGQLAHLAARLRGRLGPAQGEVLRRYRDCLRTVH